MVMVYQFASCWLINIKYQKSSAAYLLRPSEEFLADYSSHCHKGFKAPL